MTNGNFCKVIQKATGKLSLRMSFLLHLTGGVVCAVLLSWLTLFGLARYLQFVYDSSYNGSFEYVYSEETGYLISSKSFSLLEGAVVLVHIPEDVEPVREVFIGAIRGDAGSAYAVYRYALTGQSEPLMLPVAGVEGLEVNTKNAMDAYAQTCWDDFVVWLHENEKSIEAQSYIEYLGAIPTDARQAKELFQKASGETLAAPFAFFPTSMYTVQDLANRDLAKRLSYVLVILWSVLVLAIAANLFYKSRIAKPLARLQEGINDVAAGEFDDKVSLDRNDELGKLAESFDHMRVSLAEMQQELISVAEDQRLLNRAFAHDLRTPLTVLRGRIELLQSQIETIDGEDCGVYNSLNSLMAQTDKLEAFVSIMSRIQKLDECMILRKDMSYFEIAEAITQTAETFVREAGKQVRIDIITPECVSSLAAEEKDLICDIDLNALLQIEENVIANAASYAAEAVYVELSWDSVTSELRLIVLDDGPGFSEEAIKFACDPFFSSRSQSDHHGLGLHIASTLAEKHGGSITLLNLDPTGACVMIRIA